jgi:hypothetical protein
VSNRQTIYGHSVITGEGKECGIWGMRFYFYTSQIFPVKYFYIIYYISVKPGISLKKGGGGNSV